MDDIESIVNHEKVQQLLEEAERAMRLAAEVGPQAGPDVQRALDTLFKDIGRTVYNLYWSDDHGDDQVAELAEFTAETPTDETPAKRMPRIVSENDAPPGFDDDYLVHGDADDDLPPEEDAGWYTDEVEIPDGPMFTAADGLKEALPPEQTEEKSKKD